MKRISTFNMFENVMVLKPMIEFLPKLNEKTKPLGFDFYSLPGGSAVAKSRGGIMMDTAKKCTLRELVLSIFFPGHPEDRLIFDSKWEDDIKGFEIVASFSYSDSHKRPGIVTLSVDVSDKENIQRVIDWIVQVLSEMVAIGHSPSFFYVGKTPSVFDEIIPGFMPGLVAETLGSPESPRLLAEAIQRAPALATRVITAFKEGAPELWKRVKPHLGGGGGETEALADLGF